MSRWGDGPRLKDQPCPGPGWLPDGTCGRSCQSRGLCHEHARQMLRNGQTWPLRRAERVCDVTDCDRTHWAKGYCRLHYQRVQATGNTEGRKPGRPVDHIGCTVDGCTDPHKGRGLCSIHYDQHYPKRERPPKANRPERVAREPRPKPVPRVRKAKATTLPDGWFRKTLKAPKPESDGQGGDGINVYLLMQMPAPDEATAASIEAFRQRRLERGELDILEILGLAA